MYMGFLGFLLFWFWGILGFRGLRLAGGRGAGLEVGSRVLA